MFQILILIRFVLMTLGAFCCSDVPFKFVVFAFLDFLEKVI